MQKATFRVVAASAALLTSKGVASANSEPSWCQRWPVHRITDYRQTSTGILLCVSTLVVSLPSTSADIPLRPCDAMKIRSHPFCFAVSMIASYGWSLRDVREPRRAHQPSRRRP